MSLTDNSIKNAKPQSEDYKLRDEKGMYLLVKKTGAKYFRMDYRFAGKRKTISLGVYPETSLKLAREKRDEARRLIQSDIDPSAIKKTKKISLLTKTKNNFRVLATEWHEKQKARWSEAHGKRKWQFLEKDIFPALGNMPVRDITPKELLKLLERIQDRGAIETAHRVKSICGEVFRYGIVTDRCERDITQDLKGALRPTVSKHMATITDPKEISGLLNAIDNYSGDDITRFALKLSPYVMLRPGEIRCAEWSEINFEKKQWKIPAGKMKMRRAHIVPLSNQVIEILKDINKLTGDWKYIFPSLLSKERPMSNNTINTALRRMGYTKEEMTAHGFRGMASTLLHENGFDTAHIELQLAHVEYNKVKAAYNHAEYLDQRTKMLQWWADYLDSLRNG